MGQEKEKPAIDQKQEKTGAYELVLYNDDVNTFDHVINALIDVCEHTPEQAEQSAMIAHYKGKCSVLEGSFNELKPVNDEMIRRELKVKIE
ncbi:MAG: ATP-dependent Clp protease adaptor ClpS [Bacteroidales bacterium]|nr:ATP-dependent Clp protease adaptor ClpS [Bacteroidales bacterium]MCF8333218.1 ATP-dependent Clp protease adaptor ClpS [Bacteroidales bacterium]